MRKYQIWSPRAAGVFPNENKLFVLLHIATIARVTDHGSFIHLIKEGSDTKAFPTGEALLGSDKGVGVGTNPPRVTATVAEHAVVEGVACLSSEQENSHKTWVP